MKAKIEALKKRYIKAKTGEEHEIIRQEIRMLCDEDAKGVTKAALESIRETNARLMNLGFCLKI